MSLLNFPVDDVGPHQYAVQEFNGLVEYGTYEEATEAASAFLAGHGPSAFVDAQQLARMAQSMSTSSLPPAIGALPTTSSATRNGTAAAGGDDENAFPGVWGLMNAPLGMASSVFKVARNLLAGGTSAADAEWLAERTERCAEVANWRTAWLKALAWQQDGRRIAVALPTGGVRVLDAQCATIAHSHAQQTDVTTLAFNPCDPRVLAVGCASGTVLVWRSLSARTHKPHVSVFQLPVGGPVTSLGWLAGGASQFLVAGTLASSRLQLIDIHTGNVESAGGGGGISLFDTVGGVTRIQQSPDGRRLAVLFGKHSLRVYTPSAGWHCDTWRPSSGSGAIASCVWASNDTLLLAPADEARLYQLQLVPLKHLQLASVGRTQLAVVPMSASVIYDLSPVVISDDHEFERLAGGRVRQLAISTDGRRLAVAFKDHKETVALFALQPDDVLVGGVALMPINLISSPKLGNALHVTMRPSDEAGTLLTVVWDAGKVQHIPLAYGTQKPVLGGQGTTYSTPAAKLGGGGVSQSSIVEDSGSILSTNNSNLPPIVLPTAAAAAEDGEIELFGEYN